jgi:N-acetylglucosamine kinase-like BadF-type ATPase
MNAHAFVSIAQSEPVRPVIDAAALAAANINPKTRLATDYLNHFNEAIMLLELVPTMPDCIEDLMQWRVMSYREHFLATHQKYRDMVLTAYELADPHAKSLLDDCVDTMDEILTATRDALHLDLSPAVAGALAQEAAAKLRPLVARAGGVINGLKIVSDAATGGAAQAAVDALLERQS